ncbi:DUF3040 domain-containing protein [Nigerium massiliense]|uniref:DUF3040 domain-containing protein n=1 Tax=Nigerium massiliense TaxID=1522317 RepID=UPI00058EDBB3|nr:DUF3040 domain-containing protein [Nigerium massiliense]
MALSEEEQRLLEQMEAALAADDPKFASTLRGTTNRKLHRRRAALAGLGFAVGIAALVLGMQLHPIVSVIGFVIMLVSTIVALTAWQHVGDSAQQSGGAGPRATTSTSDSPFRLDERWRHGPDDTL